MHCDALTFFLGEPSSITIGYVAHNIAGKRVGEYSTRLFSSHRPGDDESILPIVTSIVDMTIVSIMNTAIPGLPHPSQKTRGVWGSQEEPDGDGGP